MARRRATRRIHTWTIGLAVPLVVPVAAWARPAFLEAVEYRLCDLRLKRFVSRVPARNAANLAIDEESITGLGRWPWPRSRMAGPHGGTTQRFPASPGSTRG
jgi:CHASE2 domain-containing sensor protein